MLDQIVKRFTAKAPPEIEFFPVLIAPNVQSPVVALAYSASITPDLSAGPWQIITATTGVAFAINAPLNPPGVGFSQELTLTIKNTSGGALGAATFNAVYKLGAAWTQPATGFSRSIQFRWDGTNWIEVGRTAADVAN